jgi:hypothetical protein
VVVAVAAVVVRVLVSLFPVAGNSDTSTLTVQVTLVGASRLLRIRDIAWGLPLDPCPLNQCSNEHPNGE